MQRDVTRSSYAERIDRVLTHIGQDIDRRHQLDDLAEVACFSAHHFHRIYRAITGETVDETVRRLRLHRAAYELNSTTQPILRIARRAGYGSTAAFTRAFSAAYGRPPADYRRTRSTYAPTPTTNGREPTMYTISIDTTPTMTLAGLPHKGDYNNIGTTFDRLSALAAAKGLFGPTTRMLGIYFDDPKCKPKSELNSFAGLTVPADFTPTDGLMVQHVPAGKIATLIHKGPYAELEKAYDFLFCDWLPTSGQEPGEAPPFEEYLNNPRELPPSEWLTKVCIPLAG
jgi:AraC family transcriptional regulator